MNEFLLENNKSQIEKIGEFLQSKTPLLLVSGFMGTGKNSVVTHALNGSSGIILEYNCFETTVLDDVLLSFFDNFKKLEIQGLIEPPKIKSDNFTQKIDAYFSTIETPLTIVIDSFEEVLKDNRREILNFIFHLPKHIKVIIIARVFNLEDFADKDYESVAVRALEKSIFDKYLRASGIKIPEILSEELYKYTRGYYLYTTFAIKVMQMKNHTPTDFMSNYNKSLMSYNEFIMREMLSLVDPVSGHLFRFLTLMRHPVPVKLLQTLNLYNEMRTNYFVQNKLLVNINNQIYLEDYFKTVNATTISDSMAVKIHKGCIELYETQLPLKPLERDLIVSRRTIRAEIEYHSMFVPRKIVAAVEQEVEHETPVVEEAPKAVQDLSFIFETEESTEALNAIAGKIEDFVRISDEEAQEREAVNKMGVAELINFAKMQEAKFAYPKAVTLYQRALLMDEDDEYYMFLPTMLTRLAQVHRNLSNWYDALKHYEAACEFYQSAGDEIKANDMKLEIARIYYDTFKSDKAKALLEKIIQAAPDNLGAYLLLIDLSDAPGRYLARALKIDSTDKRLLAELYFKQALYLDEQDEKKEAVGFYKKSIETDETKYAASAYANIAGIFEEVGEIELAIKALLEALRADESKGNKDGIYISAMKLGALYSDKQKASVYYQKALDCAQELNEPLYINAATTALDSLYV